MFMSYLLYFLLMHYTTFYGYYHWKRKIPLRINGMAAIPKKVSHLNWKVVSQYKAWPYPQLNGGQN